MVTILARGRRRMADQWAQPVYRSGYLLVLNSLATAVLGLTFWLLAARLYPPAVIGVNSTAISAMMLIAGVAQLNLMSTLLRFIPTAGRSARRMVVVAYAVGGTSSAIFAIVFLVGLDTWTPALGPFLGQPLVAVSFVAAAAGWAVMVMQTSVLVAVGRTDAATVASQVFNLSKVALLLPFVVLFAEGGVWLAWILAMAVSVVAGGWFLFRRAVMEFMEGSSSAPAHVPSLKELVGYAGPDYVAALAWICCTSVVPIMVFSLSDAEHAAVFALAWSICLTLYSVPAALGQSLVAYGVRDPVRVTEHHRRILVTSLALLTPPVVVLLLFTPLVLSPFGPWYVAEGATTVRLLALSALPNAVVLLTVSRCRIAGRMTMVVNTMVGLCVLVLGLTQLLVPEVGIAGGAMAWLAAQIVVATGIGIRRASEHWSTGLEPLDAPDVTDRDDRAAGA
jgi:O-antigen/teichoic acid export membrane protein